MPARTTGSILRVMALGAVLVLATSACSAEADPKDAVKSAVLEPQSLFTTQVTTACPEVEETAEGQAPQPQAVCVEVKNLGEDRAAYNVAVTVQDKDDSAIVYSQVVINTGPIEPGATGAGAAPAPGADRIVTKPTPDQESAGAVPASDVRLNITQVDRVAG